MTEKRKRRFGDRRDARKVRTLPPMQYVAVSVMNKRNDAQNLFKTSVCYSDIEDYIREKRENGMPGFGFMHLLVAAYVRTVSQKPAINRYVAGYNIFARHEIVLSMMVKKEMKLNAQESAIKVRFDPHDTVEDVYRKMEAEIEKARMEGDTTNLDNVARVVNKLPKLILRWFVALMQFFDFLGIMPKVIDEASPFHASIFISNLGSLGIQPIYHHLYNFGNVPIFVTFGAKRKEFVQETDGTISTKMMVDYTVVSDERITDGHYLATAFKLLDKNIRNPERLETAPETVIEDID